MKPYPHSYEVNVHGAGAAGRVRVTSPGLPAFEVAAPLQFDGPGDVWSPETLLIASVANCFVLTFRAVALAARFEWTSLECHVVGVLERIDGVAQFSRYTTHATLTVLPGGDREKAGRLLQRAEQGCLITNSLRGAKELEVHVVERAKLA